MSLWCLKIALSHSLLRSYENISNLFSVIFSDSDIAKSFSVGKTKCEYYINFGIAPYFRFIIREIQVYKILCCFYDESLNTILEEEEMDIIDFLMKLQN